MGGGTKSTTGTYEHYTHYTHYEHYTCDRLLRERGGACLGALQRLRGARRFLAALLPLHRHVRSRARELGGAWRLKGGGGRPPCARVKAAAAASRRHPQGASARPQGSRVPLTPYYIW